MKSQAYPESLNVAASTSGSQNLPLDIREVVYNFIATINSSASPINIDAQAERILQASGMCDDPINFQEVERVLQDLTPEDRLAFERLFTNMREAYLELANNPDRDCFSEAEYARYFGDLEQVDLVLEGPNMEKSDVEIVEHLLDQGFSIMSVMEKSRQRSFGERNIQALLENVTPDALATNDRDDENPQCLICREDFLESNLVVVQLPCHSTHQFHRVCINLQNRVAGARFGKRDMQESVANVTPAVLTSNDLDGGNSQCQIRRGTFVESNLVSVQFPFHSTHQFHCL
ncbi:hypothetical protein PGTUg99_001525 [Puccinia graminis f. sp. tritici]|uniref:RING-type domain-containing protein n=2 Tax=Puccinia graminis f. sp. tritici TaxID=56615 RepID=E3JVM4_PUCGT|nr:uncharacterized protein PGTG_02540 [Puccinia graminis f. sp. tritici CRL 75-36-700-3]EFP76099.1 hypothetical protein PGTG_02540 [Puccinia graminis f. sp. tritici CRL 75-36-700-3]KAA1077094.1 hypothetical protein PGTUg99_001525 [Puccinia graminis f. sp. tritici]